MRLIDNSSEHWFFIRRLRYHPENVLGFVKSLVPSNDEQVDYMSEHNDDYKICLNDDGDSVGFIGDVDGDIRLAVSPDHKGKGVGKFMLSEYAKIKPHARAKVKHGNIPSLRTFLSCGFVVSKADENFSYLTRKEYGNYKIKHNPYEIVTMFEESIADYTGAPYALSVDSCTNA